MEGPPPNKKSEVFSQQQAGLKSSKAEVEVFEKFEVSGIDEQGNR